MTHDDTESDQLLCQAAQGDGEAVTRLLSRYRDQLCRMVACHLDNRLAARVDASDVVQETLVVAADLLTQYVEDRPMPFYAWLRYLASQRLIDLQRRHLGAQRRSVHREQLVECVNDSTLHYLAQHFLVQAPGPRSALWHSERRQRLRQALEMLEPNQRELMLMLYVEDLTAAEAADILQITAEAARMRHLRALKRLREILDADLRDSRP